ncbi:indoleamine 2,3-dioxygenase 2-like [Diadema antillarum]|uniref:indoleamine 2,3-dioxygenase 2-like n=1 Tax=Diadema antillarum TaxID=105358 RepID=UPI003A83741C
MASGGERAEVVSRLEDFKTSPLFGFVDQNPATHLPAYFKPWEDLAYQTSTLVLQSGLMRAQVHSLPLLDHTRLGDDGEWKAALVFLTCITYGYVWCEGDDEVPEVLPRCVAVPYMAVATRLEVPPSINMYSFILLNWKLKDPKGPVKLDNMDSIVNLRAGVDESWFYCTTAQVELDFAPALTSIIKMQKACEQKSVEVVVEELSKIENTVCQMRKSLRRMPECCQPQVFFNVFRPFIRGWDSDPFKRKNLKGLIYEGVSTEPFSFTGLSAAQSCTLPCLDAAFGIVHNTNEEESRDQFLNYAPRSHRELIRTIKKGPSVREFVSSSGSAKAMESFNACLEAIRSFRDAHLQIVTRFIVLMANEKKTEASTGDQGLTGTGGTDLMSFLKGLRDTSTGGWLGQTESFKGISREFVTSVIRFNLGYHYGRKILHWMSVSAAAAALTAVIMRRFFDL